MSEDDDQLRADEIQPITGRLEEWCFEEGESEWSIRVECREVKRPDSSSAVSVGVEGIDFGLRASGCLAGADVVVEGNDEPLASIYFYEHYAYDRAVVRVLGQRGAQARVSVELTGDLYGLGIERIEVTADVEVVPAARAVSLDWD